MTPTTPLAAENTAVTGIISSGVFRIRVAIAASDGVVASGEAFKLQYSPDQSSWYDVGGIGSGTIWRGYDNAGVADGASLPSTLLSAAVTSQTYEEANNAATVSAILTGASNASEWDWVVQDNNALPETSYYFRMVKSDDSLLDVYSNTPQVTTAAATLTQNTYRWYENLDAIQPTTPLAAENTSVSGVAETDVLRLRISAEASAPCFFRMASLALWPMSRMSTSVNGTGSSFASTIK